MSTTWTTATLAAQIRGELGGNPDAAGGSVPDRVTNLVVQAGMSLWHARDWHFRRKQGTLSIEEDDSVIALPADFGELDGRRMRAYSTTNRMWFTQDAGQWRARADAYAATDTGAPKYAIVTYDTYAVGESTATGWRAHFRPVADDDYTFYYFYLTADPWTGGLNSSTAPSWPATFGEGWHLLALHECQKRFGRDKDLWESTKSDYEKWLWNQILENDETMSGGETIMRDAMGDFDLVPSSGGIANLAERDNRSAAAWL